MKKIIVLNLGSTSFKFKLFDYGSEARLLASGGVENIGSASGAYRITVLDKELKGECLTRLHGDAFDLCINALREHGALASLSDLDAVGYKAVHGGPVSGVRPVDEELLSIMDSFVSFAPAHNPVYIRMMRQIKEQYPQLKQFAYFETSFHTTVPLHRAVYGVPYEWVEEYGIRRYGFHGSSHSFIAHEIARLEPSAKRVISVHLGGSSSLCAIKDGRSIATSMGATPQSGIFHNNRVGDFDVFCIPELLSRHGGDLSTVMKALSSKSGFLGISGVSNDLREIIAAMEAGNERAGLAVRAFVDGIVGYIGMYTAYLGGLDVIVFTGGIGQRSSLIRSMVCENLGFLRVELDAEKNSKSAGKVSSENSGVSVWAVETNEELMVASKVRDYILNT